MNTNQMRALLGAALLAVTGLANAASATVDALANSTGGGTPLLTGIELTAGEQFTVTTNTGKTWDFSWNDPTYFVDANGQAGNYMSLLNPDGSTFTGLTGSLIGEIGSGDYFTIGTSLSSFANATGELKLSFLDSDAYNNTGSATATITAVPEPSMAALLGLGMAGIAIARRRRKA